MKITSTICACGLGISSALAGPSLGGFTPAPSMTSEADAFASARSPITNPTLFDLALPRTLVRVIGMNHQFPDQLNLAGGGQAPFGGDLQLYALQFEYAFNERLSLVALKDGYVDFNPDASFTPEEGFANLGAGLKYAFIYDPANQFVASGTLAVELPTGNRDVFQGEGDGNIILTGQTLKLAGPWQFAFAGGVQVPIDSDFSTQAFLSTHVSYEVNRWFIPLIEANYFTVLNEGNGGNRFSGQLGGGVPANAPSEGADLLNFGASESEDYATLGVGFQSRFTDQLTFGAAYEFALTDEEDNITEDRVTVDLTYVF